MNYFDRVLPPTKADDQIRVETMRVASEIVGQPLTVRQKRKVENMRVEIPCSACRKNTLLGHLHKCLYCEQWYCTDCAEEHFGKTRQKYHEDKIAKADQPTGGQGE